MADFDALRTAWAKTRSGKGGINALAGFEFQLSRALLAVIEAHARGSGETFVEALSDLVEADGGILIAQAKRTLNSGSLAKAMDEFWSIRELAKTVAPGIVEQLIFQVQVSKSALVDWRASANGWTPSDAFDEAEVKAFCAAVTMTTSPWPRIEAARILMTRYRDSEPLTRFDRFLGRLLSAASAGAFEVVVDELKVELSALVHAAEAEKDRFNLWGETDKAPERVTIEQDKAKAVRAGQRLSLSDLREGRLARRRVYEEVAGACEAWIGDADRGSDKLSAFWIEGRSGSGKSAALLHLMHMLHATDPAQRVVLWLGSRSNLVSDAIHWASDLIHDGFQVIIGLDDPFTAANHQLFLNALRQAHGEWERIRDLPSRAAHESRYPPLLVCCGPIEQRYAAESASVDEVSVRAYRLRPETSEDLQELASWYEKRTGMAPPAIEGDVLLVQRFFEWTNGRLTDFALRLKRRLLDFDKDQGGQRVFDVFARILALGRLYVDYPYALLKAEADAHPYFARAMEQLSVEEEHLSIAADEEGGMGVRLTHPHLADAIYREWFGAPLDRPLRASHLKSSLQAALRNDHPEPSVRLAPFWGVARLLEERFFSDEELRLEVQKRIGLVAKELAQILPELYRNHDFAGAELSDLPVWVDFNHRLELALDPHPMRMIADAAAKATTPVKGLRLSCHKLIEHKDAAALAHVDVRGVINDVLIRLAEWREDGLYWREWGPIAAHFIGAFGGDDIRIPLLRLAQRAPDLPALSAAMHQLSRAGDEPDPIVLKWLENASVSAPSWPNILMALHQRFGAFAEFETLALHFLGSRPEHFLWSWTWESLKNAGLGGATLNERGLAWIGAVCPSSFAAGRSDAPGSDRVWQRLWDDAETANDGVVCAQLITRGHSWLESADPRTNAWSHLWVRVYKACAGDATLAKALQRDGLDWLGDFKEHSGWSFVWHALATGADDADLRRELSALATVWLYHVHPEHLGWLYVWETEFAAANEDTKSGLARQLLQWLRHLEPSNPHWPIGRRKLLDTGFVSKAEFSPVAIAWLQRADPHIRGWSIVWRAEYGNARSDIAKDLLAKMDIWLETGDLDLLEWGAAARRRLQVESEGAPENLLARLEAWLDAAAFDQTAWSANFAVAAGLTNANGNDTAKAFFLARGIAWLGHQRDSAKWGWVWLAALGLTEGSSSAPLYELANAWLPNTVERQVWEAVWMRCAYDSPEQFDVVAVDEALRAWLLTHGAAARAFPILLTRRARLKPEFLAGERLVEEALVWLKQGHTARWTHVWRAAIHRLTKSDAGHRELVELGVGWLKSHRPDKVWWAMWRHLFTTLRFDEADRSRIAALGVEALRDDSEGLEIWIQIYARFQRVQALVWASDVAPLNDLWLAKSASDTRWRGVWRSRVHALPEVRPNEAVLDAAIAWLQSSERAKKSWAYVWNEVGLFTKSDVRRETVWCAIGLEWLTQAHAETPGWSFVWHRLRRRVANNDRARFARLGETWIKANRNDERGRTSIGQIVRNWRARRTARRVSGD